jgi:hypothetical protein
MLPYTSTLKCAKVKMNHPCNVIDESDNCEEDSSMVIVLCLLFGNIVFRLTVPL